MSNTWYAIEHCQDCAFYEPSKHHPEHSGKCLSTNSWTDPNSRKCSRFILADNHQVRMCPRRSHRRQDLIARWHDKARKDNIWVIVK